MIMKGAKIMKKTNKIVLAALGAASAATAAAAAAAYAATKLLVKTALDREEPPIIKRAGIRISGSDENAEFREASAAAAELLKEQNCDYVEIMSHDGLKLIGHFYPCEDAKRVIIAFHGWRSSWYTDYGMITEFWHKNGCSVLYVEQRGQNGSGGEHMGFGLTERYDCIEWINWVICRCGKNIPIYLAGISMGATTVLMAADLNLPKNIHGIMADCGFTSPSAIWTHVARNNLHMAYRVTGAMANAMCKKKIRVGSEEYSTIDALKNTDIPILFVHGTDDHFVPVEMTYENYKACASPKRLLIVPGADHAMSYYVDKAGYEEAVLSFWRDFDGGETDESAE